MKHTKFKELLAEEPIVIIDDNVELAQLIKEVLTEYEVPIKIFEDPKKAIEDLRLLKPSLILMDYNMSGLNGIQTTNEIRKFNFQVPIILISGYATKEVAVQGLSAGLNDLLDKPFDNDKLLALADRWLNARCDYLMKEKEELESILDSFVEEGLGLMRGIDELILRLTEPELDRLVVDNLFRRIHSIKGAAGAVPFTALLGRLSHMFESVLDLIRKQQVQPDEDHVDLFLTCADMVLKLLNSVGERHEPPEEYIPLVDAMIERLKQIQPGTASTTKAATVAGSSAVHASAGEAAESEDAGLLVNHQKLDNFLKLSGEMTMVRNYFQLLTRDAKAHNDPEVLFKKAEEMLRGFNSITESLQKNIMEIRQVQFQEVFSKLPRLVRNAARECGKKIHLQTIGGHLSVDKSIAKDLAVVLSHMVRNSIDHGIENESSRAAVGKPTEGQLIVETTVSNGLIVVEVRDDGGGIDPKKILAKAIEKGLVDEAQSLAMKDADIFQIIFLPGFSTAAAVTSISGRGVGMDVVKNLITSHHGKIEITSSVGQGSTFRLSIPVPRSIMVENTILMKYEDLFFVIPQTEILQISQAGNLETQKVGMIRYFQFKGMTIPLVSFDELVQKRTILTPDQLAPMSIVVLQHGDASMGLLVHGTEGQLDAVILPFDGMVKKIQGFKGTTLLGSDGIAFVASSQQLLQMMNEFNKPLEVAA